MPRLSTSSGCASGSGAADLRCSAARGSPASSSGCSGSSTIGEEATDEEIWRSVELARHDDRPYTLDYVERLLDDWFELHGDRALGDDGAMIAGPRQARRAAQSPSSASRRDATSTSARAAASGCRTPRATARRCTRWSIAERHGFPVISLVDTPGAYPGRRRRAARSGRCDRELAGDMARLTVPTVACVIGEGGSGRRHRDRAR
jgi:acetyl-CoA carboxylase alpha subunit